MSNGVDLKMTTEDAIRLLGNETRESIDRIRRVGESLAEELSASIKTRADLPSPPHVATAVVAAIIDFPFRGYGANQRSSQMQLAFNGQGVGAVDVARGLLDGRYRALITIERLGDLD